jgi:hypothetical protein
MADAPAPQRQPMAEASNAMTTFKLTWIIYVTISGHAVIPLTGAPPFPTEHACATYKATLREPNLDCAPVGIAALRTVDSLP